MASNKTTPEVNADLDAKYDAPAVFYCGILTAVTSIGTPTVTESADPGYARLAITWGAAAARKKSNSAILTFAAATINNATVKGWGIYENLAGGNPIEVCLQAPELTYTIGYQPQVAIGSLYIEEAAAAS